MTSPHWRFGLLSFGGALVLSAAVGYAMNPLLAWLVAVNMVAVITYRYDKMVAGSARTRVPEQILLLLASAGGSVGAAAAMWLIRPRHKTQSGAFLFWFILIAAIQAGALLFFLGNRL